MSLLEDLSPTDLGLPEKFTEFRQVQIEAAPFALYGPTGETEDARRFHCLGLPPGCHGDPTQLVLLADGSRKAVSEVQVGDVLAGHGLNNRVLRLNRGVGELVEIKPVKGDSFVVNLDHVLTLTWSGKKDVPKSGRVVDMSVRKFMGLGAFARGRYKLFRTLSLHRSETLLPMYPYLVGLILGDGCITGSNNSVSVTKLDPEVGHAINEEVKKFGLIAKPHKNGRGWNISKGVHGPGNRVLETLRTMGLWGTHSATKFIPEEYLLAGYEQRAELLAGLIDTDGSYSPGHGFDFVSSSKNLADGVVYLSRSLGLAAYLNTTEKFCQTGAGGVYYRVSISGELTRIPTRIPRKQAGERRQIKDVLVTGFDIRPIGEGEYWGFTLSGDGRYLLGDFTVTHNSGKSLLGHTIGALSGGRYGLLTATKSLENQQVKDGFDLTNVRGRNNYTCRDLAVLRTCQQQLPRREATCEVGEEEDCRLYGTPRCTYGGVVEDAKRSNAVLTNYMYWMTTRGANPAALEGAVKEEYEYFDRESGIVKQGKRTVGSKGFEMLICDEAHLIPAQLAKFLGVWISTANLRHYAKEEVGEMLGRSKGAEWGKVGDGWLAALGSMAARMDSAMLEIAGEYESGEEAKRNNPSYRKLAKILTSLERVIRLGGDNNWIWKHEGAGIAFECVWPAKYAEKYLWTGIPKIVLMSATLRPKTLNLAGISSRARWFKEWPRIFPAKLSPVYWVPTGRMGFKVSEDEKLKSVGRLDEMARLWEGRRGIVHTPSFHLAEWLAEKAGCSRRMVVHRKGDKADDVEKRYRATPGAILVSPSFHTGSDFADSACEWQHIPKLPFPDKSDPVMQARCEEDREYYSAETMQRLVQTCGRGSRHEADPCTCVAPDTKVLTDDLRWVRADSLNVLDRVLGFDELGHGRKNGRRWKWSTIVEAQTWDMPRVRVVYEGGELVCTPNHPLLTLNNSRCIVWEEAQNLKPGRKLFKLLNTWETVPDYASGWLGGFFDGEGHLNLRYSAKHPNVSTLSASQKMGTALSHAMRMMEICGFDYAIRKTGQGADKNLVKTPEQHGPRRHIVLKGGHPEILRFLGQTRPVRLLNKFTKGERNEKIKAIAYPRVIRIEKLSKGPITSLQTSTATFVTDGLGSHNTIITDDMVKAFRFYAGDAAPRWFKVQDAPGGKVPGPQKWLADVR